MTKVIRFFTRETETTLEDGKYLIVYIFYGLISFGLFTFLNVNELLKTLNILIVILIFLLFYYIRLSIKKKHLDLETRYYYFSGWSLALLLFISLILSYVDIYERFFVFLYLIIFLSLIYYYTRFLLIKYVTNWYIFSAVFMLMPLISVFFWSLIKIVLQDIIQMKLYLSNQISLWIVFLLSIAIVNLLIYWTPKERIDEVRVATYFLLAVFSTISYCFFITDYLALFLSSYLTELKTKEIEIMAANLVRWILLPYLVGSVFASFSIELVSRNENRRKKYT